MTGTPAFLQSFGKRGSLHDKPQEARLFYGAIGAVTLAGVLINCLGFNPMKMLVWSGVVQGFSVPPLLVLMLGRLVGTADDTTQGLVLANLAPPVGSAAAVAVKVPFVMVSTAIYTRIDASHPAAFSKRVIGGMLRTALGYQGVVISDDLGGARQVAGYSVASRALRFENAGGDMILTVVPSQAGTMTSAILARMRTSPAFAKHVRNAALRVLRDKQSRGLLD